MSVNIVRKIDGAVRVRHVLLSVSDKTGLNLLVPGLLKALERLIASSVNEAGHSAVGEEAAADLEQLAGVGAALFTLPSRPAGVTATISGTPAAAA